jgi:hypothetical protein
MFNKNIISVCCILSILVSSTAQATETQLPTHIEMDTVTTSTENTAVDLTPTVVPAAPRADLESGVNYQPNFWQGRTFNRIKTVVFISIILGGIGGLIYGVGKPAGYNPDAGNPDGPLPFVPTSEPFTRGMYVSMWSTMATDPTLAGQYNNILGDSQKEARLLAFIRQQKIDSLSLYNLPVILDMKGMAEKLSQFIVAAKNSGIKEVLAAGSKKGDWQVYSEFQKIYPSRIDGIIAEVEFWNDLTDRTASYQNFLTLLDDMKAFPFKNQGRPFKLTTYMGLLNSVPNVTEQEVASEIVKRVDRIILHSYDKDPTTAYLNAQGRMITFAAEIAAQSKSTQLVPLVSTEGTEFSAGGGAEVFLGNWLQQNPSLGLLERDFDVQMYKDIDSTKINGFYYYEYQFVDYDLTHTKNISSVSN